LGSRIIWADSSRKKEDPIGRAYLSVHSEAVIILEKAMQMHLKAEEYHAAGRVRNLIEHITGKEYQGNLVR